MIVAMLLTVGQSAHASYICGLSTTDVDDAITHYSWSMTRAQISPWLDAPFACSQYEDLCELVGSTDAKTIVCDMWDDVTNEVVEATVQSNVETAIAAGMAGYNYGYGTVVSDCSNRVNFDTVGLVEPSHQIRVRGGRYNVGLWKRIGGSTKGWMQDINGWLFQDPNGEVLVENDYTCVDGATTCDLNNDETDTDDDGYVQEGRTSAWGTAMVNSVDVYGEYEPSDDNITLTECAQRHAGWNCNCE